MFKYKQLYATIFALLTLIISYFFYTYTKNLDHQLAITHNEISGVDELNKHQALINLLQQYRGLYPVTPSVQEEKKALLQRKKELREAVNRQISELRAHEHHVNVPPLSQPTVTNAVELFDELSQAIAALNNEILFIADITQLLYEPDRTNYLLMEVMVYTLPEFVEAAAQIRGVATRGLTSAKQPEDEMILENNRYLFERFHDALSTSVSMLDDDVVLRNAVEQIYSRYQSYLSHIHDTRPQSALGCFHEGSEVVEAIYALSRTVSGQLTGRLEARAAQLKRSIFAAYSIFGVGLILVLSLTLFSLRRESEKNRLETAQKNSDALLQQLQSTLHAGTRLKGICDESLSFIASHFHASGAVLYLYNNKNRQLELGATYGLDPSTLAHTLRLGEGSIGQNALDKKIVEEEIEEFSEASIVEMGAVNARAKKVLTFPLLYLDNNIGNIQLVLLEDKSLEHAFLTRLASLSASYIYKASKSEESRKYLASIDKNVITSSTDANGIIIEVSQAFADISGYTKEELIGNAHSIVRHPDMPRELFKELWQSITKGKVWHGEVKNRTKQDGYYWVDVTITPSFDLYGNITGYTAIRHDISDRKKVEEIAITDGLTKLFNRRHFDDLFALRLKEAERDSKNLAFVLLDIDHFKQYNDTYGHQEGDNALIGVASALRSTLKRPRDLVFRLGGEEFGLLYDAQSADEANAFAIRVKNAVEELKIDHAHNSASRYVTVSMGLLFIMPHSSCTPDSLYKSADDMLYLAKENGRNNVRMKIVEPSA